MQARPSSGGLDALYTALKKQQSIRSYASVAKLVCSVVGFVPIVGAVSFGGGEGSQRVVAMDVHGPWVGALLESLLRPVVVEVVAAVGSCCLK